MSFPKYTKYKDSGILWFGDIPEHWSMTRLGWICSNINDINHEMPEAVYEGVPFLSNKDLLDDGTLDFKSNVKLISEEDFERLSQKIRPQRDDIIYSRIGTLGKARLVETDQRFLISYSCCVVRVSEEAVCKKFICHLLDGEMLLTEARMRTKGIGVPDLGLGEISRFPIPLPPRDDQTKISSFLDRETSKIDALLGEQRRLIELLKEKRQAVISHAVTKGLNPRAPLKPSGIEWLGDVPEHWNVTRVKRFTQILRGKFTHRPRHDPAMYGGPYPFIQTGEISQSSRFVGEHQQTLSEAGFTQSKQFPRGTLVMTITGAGTANVAILDFEACFPDSIVGFVPAKGVSLDYLYILFTAMRDALLETSVTNTQPNLNIERIGALLTVQPPIDEQHEIVRHVEAISAAYEFLTAEAERAIELQKERRTALISAAVTGKIDVREFVEKEPA